MIFYTIGNTNLRTVNLVAQVIADEFKTIEKVVIFNTDESNKYQNEQAKCYRKFLGQRLRIEEIIIDDTGLLDPNTSAAIFKEKSEKIIDITNGQKTTAAVLYLIGSLLSVSYVVYVKIKVIPKDLPNEPIKSTHFDFIKVPTYNNLPSIAKISHFDLIYYLDEINSIFDQDKEIQRFKHELTTAVIDFFGRNTAKNIIVSATSCEEVIRKKLYSFLTEYPPAVAFAKNCRPELKQGKILWWLQDFFTEYSKSPSYDQNLSPLVTVGGLLGTLHSYRNLAAHWARSGHDFGQEEGRVAILLAIELFRVAKLSPGFWEYINKV